MESVQGRMVAKGGAEGLECVGIPARRWGIAVKCEDGQSRALGPAVVSLLQHLGELTPSEIESLRSWQTPVIHNHAGLETGNLSANVEILSTAAR